LDSPEREPLRLAGAPPRILVIQAPYYAQVVGGMREGAKHVLDESGATLEVIDVAGAYELPAALRMAVSAASSSPDARWDGFLILGCVVRGETDHYEFICGAVCHGVMSLATTTGVAIGFGLLTVDTLAQAVARSSGDRHNKGTEAAQALLGQIALRRRWGL
jgi:6,7-dimethyl-8-ribityllumazine synthase